MFISVLNPRPSQKEPVSHTCTISTCTEFNFEDVCKPGNTLLWDLVQDDKAVSINLDHKCLELYV